MHATLPCRDTLTFDPKALSIIGRGLLERVVAVYEDFGVPVPQRQFWSAGNVPPECSQIVVALKSLSEGLTGSEETIPSPCDNLVQAKFSVTVTRCIPTPDNRGTPPSPAQIAEASDLASQDAYLLAKAACSFDMYGSDVPGAPLGGMGVEWSVTVNDYEGGMQTVELDLTTVIG